jgi:lysophospholipase L1-like esterase
LIGMTTTSKMLKLAIAFACPLMIVAPALGAQDSPWVATWGTALVDPGSSNYADLTGETLRMVVHTSVGGPQVRIWLSNRFGTAPLKIGAAHIAMSADPNPAGAGTDVSGIKLKTDRALTFDHRAFVVIAPGATIVSDPVALNVDPLSDLAVSLYFPERTLGNTIHGGANQTAYAIPGNVVDAASMPARALTRGSWYFLSGVDVYAPGASAVVAYGDSITDGNHSTTNSNHRWPDYLAARLAADPATRKAGVLGMVNTGISGNRVLLDGDGPSAMARLEWDVLSRSGVKYLILFHGINDIEYVARFRQPYGDLVQGIEAGLTQIATQAHDHGIRVIGATQMTDCRPPQCVWPEQEAARTELNQWIRTTDVFDGVIDFDLATHDPEHSTWMLQEYNSGDYVHPNDVGYKAMSNAIDLTLLTKAATKPR